jgi:hypothetical protein
MPITIDGSANSVVGVQTVTAPDGSSNALAINASGYVLGGQVIPYVYGTPSHFSSNINDNFSVGRSQQRLITFTSGKFTVPTGYAGTYIITFNGICGSDSARHDSGLQINGGTIVSMLSEADGQGYHQRNAVLVYKLNVGDYVTWYHEAAYQNSNSYDTWQTASIAYLGA